jgi:hypothetical protein
MGLDIKPPRVVFLYSLGFGDKGNVLRLTEEEIVDVMEVSEIGINLNNPIWLGQDNGANEEPTPPLGQEGLQLHPSDNIVQTPGGVKEDCCN